MKNNFVVHGISSFHGQVVGFLGGINWALLVARICQLYPNALPNMLVSRFFRVYSQWRWPNPVMICAIEKGSLGLDIWDPIKNFKDRGHLMPIITPAYPSMNSSYNVSSSTLWIMTEEFKRGHNICEVISFNSDPLLLLFYRWKTQSKVVHLFGLVCFAMKLKLLINLFSTGAGYGIK